MLCDRTESDTEVVMAALDVLVSLLCLLLALLCHAVRRAEASYYYEIVPYVTLSSSRGDFERKFVGSYASYASADDAYGRLLRAPAELLECEGRQQATDSTSNSTLVSYSGSILLLELTECSDYFQASVVDYRLNADGLIFYYLLTDDGSGGEDKRRVSLGYRPEGSNVLQQFAVVLVGLTPAQLLELESVTANSSDVTVRIEPGQRQNAQTSHTFYFVVFAFAILMLLSCLWFVTSYLRRCRGTVRDRRRMVNGVGFISGDTWYAAGFLCISYITWLSRRSVVELISKYQALICALSSCARAMAPFDLIYTFLVPCSSRASARLTRSLTSWS